MPRHERKEHGMAELDENLRKALREPNFWHVATVNPDGSPHVTTVWADLRDGDRILVNSAVGRRKPRVALSFHTSDGGYRSGAIQGRVVESYTGDQADQDIDALAKKYLGEDKYPWRAPDEQRVSFLIEPTHAFHMGG
jgi:PPOX class probable F420-dependent enzyme